jgi:small GTP-binding protein
MLPLPEKNLLKLKICLVGESQVGKTSLIKKFVYDVFDDTYSSTIGTKVTKRQLSFTHPDNGSPLDVYMLIWDLMGEQSFLEMLKVSYFFGARGLIAVCDTTRKDTLPELERWIESAHSVTREVPMVILGNKCDLEDERQVEISEIQEFAKGYKDCQAFLSSVKSGYNVEHTFNTLTEMIVRKIS